MRANRLTTSAALIVCLVSLGLVACGEDDLPTGGSTGKVDQTVACDPSSPCPEGKACVAGQCVGADCKSDTDCKEIACPLGGSVHETCVDGKCLPPTKACPAQTTCSGPNPQGCANTGCPQGQICDLSICTSTACQCDAQTGSWFCTPDCNGGQCVPDAQAACPGPNPEGCVHTGCPQGQVCKMGIDVCASTTCECQNGWWLCTPDCMGGKCVPAGS